MALQLLVGLVASFPGMESMVVMGLCVLPAVLRAYLGVGSLGWVSTLVLGLVPMGARACVTLVQRLVLMVASAGSTGAWGQAASRAGQPPTDPGRHVLRGA